MRDEVKTMMNWIARLWPVWLSVVAVIGFVYQTQSRLAAAEARFERVETAIADLQRTITANASTVATLSSLVARDARDIDSLSKAAEANRATTAEIKGDIKEIKAVLQRIERNHP